MNKIVTIEKPDELIAYYAMIHNNIAYGLKTTIIENGLDFECKIVEITKYRIINPEININNFNKKFVHYLNELEDYVQYIKKVELI